MDFENSSEGDSTGKIESLLLGRKSKEFTLVPHQMGRLPHAENMWEIHKNLHPEVPFFKY